MNTLHQDGSELHINLEFTPNPNTLKYSVNRVLLERGAVQCVSMSEAKTRSPLAERLLGVPGLAAVMIGRDFITVTKDEAGEWESVHEKVNQTLRAHLEAGLPIIHEGFDALQSSPSASGTDTGDSSVESRIKAILDAEVRPAVAMDGGDITFDRYEGGVVYLEMKGACSGCPSSTATLKMGVETRLKAAIPEIIEVVAV